MTSYRMTGHRTTGHRTTGHRSSGAIRALFTMFAWAALTLGGCATLERHTPTAPGGAFAAAPPTNGVILEAWVGEPEESRSTEVMTLYRVWGGSARQLGAWLSPTAPRSGGAIRAAMALPPQNEALFWCVVTVPAGVLMRTGVAAPAFGQPGGGRQVELLERIPASSFGDIQPLTP